VWLPLDPTPSGAAVQYVAGSHGWPEYSPFHFATGLQYAGTGMPPLPDIAEGVREGRFQLLSWPDAMPGDVIVFSAMTVHGQLEESTSEKKERKEQEGSDDVGGQFRRLATRWTGDDARYVLRHGEARDVIPSSHFPCTLSAGDEIECERFPLVWTQS